MLAVSSISSRNRKGDFSSSPANTIQGHLKAESWIHGEKANDDGEESEHPTHLGRRYRHLEPQQSVRSGRVEHDLIVFPELLDKPPHQLIATRACGAPQDLSDRSFAVNCGEDPLLSRVYGKGEVRICVGPIDEDRY